MGRLARAAKAVVVVVIGIAASYLPFVPRVELSPEVVLVGFLADLLLLALDPRVRLGQR